MLNLGLTEIIVVLVVAIVVVGPERLPTVVRWLGRQYGKLMRASDELPRTDPARSLHERILDWTHRMALQPVSGGRGRADRLDAGLGESAFERRF